MIAGKKKTGTRGFDFGVCIRALIKMVLLTFTQIIIIIQIIIYNIPLLLYTFLM